MPGERGGGKGNRMMGRKGDIMEEKERGRERMIGKGR